MNLDNPATVSVLVSGLVAVVGILAPILGGLIGVITDSLKSSWERKTAIADKLDQATVDLLAKLSNFGGVWPEDAAASDRSFEAAYSNLLSSYYAWELTVFPKCQQSERDKLQQFREDLEQCRSHPQRLCGDSAIRLASGVSELHRIARGRIWERFFFGRY